jgi:hypothetical protein
LRTVRFEKNKNKKAKAGDKRNFSRELKLANYSLDLLFGIRALCRNKARA